MPPTNITIATAMEITSLPFSIDQNITGLVPDGSGNIDLWYFYTAISGDNILGSLGKKTVFTSSGDGPWNQVFLGPVGAPTSYLASVSATNGREQVPVTVGTTYYWVMRWDGGAGVFDETFTLKRFSDAASYSADDFLINSDEPGYPLSVVNPTTCRVTKFYQNVVGGEGADQLNSGRMIFSNANGGASIYNPSFSLVANISISLEVGWGNKIDTFYVLEFGVGSARNIRAIASDGTLGQTWALPAVTVNWVPRLVAVSPDETIAYITNVATEANGGGNIARWDLVNNVALTDLAAVVTGRNLHGGSTSPGILLTLPNGNILAGYWNNALSIYFLRLYTPAGTTVWTSTFTGIALLDRAALKLTDNTIIWVWGKPSFGLGAFYKIGVSDGVIITTSPSDAEVQDGGSFKLRASQTAIEFGQPFSCPFLVALSSVNQRSGIYTLSGTGANFAVDNPRLTHDVVYIDAVSGTTENMSIPNPFGETYEAADR